MGYCIFYKQLKDYGSLPDYEVKLIIQKPNPEDGRYACWSLAIVGGIFQEGEIHISWHKTRELARQHKRRLQYIMNSIG